MAYNFNKTPERRNTNSIKWTRYPADVIPLWVADMDFQAPKPILNGLRAMIDHGVLGYDIPTTSLQETVAARMDALYKWKVKPEAVSAVTGIVTGFSVAARAFGSPKKGIMIQTPVYNEFHEVKNNVGIRQLDVPLVKSVEGNIIRYEIDWDVFKKQAKKAGMFLLCNPHNPLGIIYSRKDLQRMAEICLENDVLMISDEIHSELLLDGNTFTPMAKLSSEIANHTITLVAPSKTYNVPGLFCGFAIIPNMELRERYNKVVEHLCIHVSSTGLQAAQIGFSGQCDEWLAELRKYLTGNRDFLVDYVTKYLPGVRTTIPDATYLGWLDFTQTPVNVAPYDFFLKEAKVAFSDGRVFGKEGEGHVRVNYGTSRSVLKDGLDRVRKALGSM
jgi:cystathionine beta-lyase